MVDVQKSMLKESSRDGYHRSIPFPPAFRLKKSLEEEAVLAYYVETFSNRSCAAGIHKGYTLETLVAQQFSTSGQVAELFNRSITVSDPAFPHCERKRFTDHT